MRLCSPAVSLALLGFASLFSGACTHSSPPAAVKAPTPSAKLQIQSSSSAATQPRPVCEPSENPKRAWSAILLSGGHAPEDNAVAHEHNLVFTSRTLSALGTPLSSQHILFADGNDPEPDVQYEEPNVVRMRRLFAIGLLHTPDDASHDATLRYRNHLISSAQSADYASVLHQLLADAAEAQQQEAHNSPEGPSSTVTNLFFYVTDHGRKAADTTNNVIVLWGNRNLRVRELGAALDAQPPERRVVAVMAQCFSGAFAAMVYKGGDSRQRIAPHDRCGFFAAPADRPAAGCSPKNDSSLYDDYTTRFFAALDGHDRSGHAVANADLDGDGRVSFEEAHLSAIMLERNMDVPVSTSEEFLRRERAAWLAELTTDGRPLRDIFYDARTPVQRTASVLLSTLNLSDILSIHDIRRRADAVRARCWPGLCEAEEELAQARMGAHKALRRAAGAITLIPARADLALILFGNDRVDALIQTAEPYFDDVLRLEAAVEKHRAVSEEYEARLERLRHLAELQLFEKRARAEGGELMRGYEQIRACETSSLSAQASTPILLSKGTASKATEPRCSPSR